MKGFGLSGLLAFGIVATLCSGGSAAAQPVISGTFYEDSKGVGCGASECELEFAALPNNKIRFTKVNCAMQAMPSDIYQVKFAVRDTSGLITRRQEYLPFQAPVFIQSLRYYTFSATTDFVFAPGKYPVIMASKTGGAGAGTLTCKITGHVEP